MENLIVLINIRCDDMEGANTLHLLHDFNDSNVVVLFLNYYVRFILLIYFDKSVSEGPVKCLLTLSLR